MFFSTYLQFLLDLNKKGYNLKLIIRRGIFRNLAKKLVCKEKVFLEEYIPMLLTPLHIL